MTKREAEKVLKKTGFHQDKRHDHREWWSPNASGLTIYLDGPRNIHEHKYTIAFFPWKRDITQERFERIVKAILDVKDTEQYKSEEP